MAFSYGFYNAVNHDRKYDAIQFSEIFDGIIADGVYENIGDKFMVKASETDNMVVVGSGRAWLNHTWNKNDTDLPVEADPSELLLDRIDALVIDIQSGQDVRTNDIIWVKGTPSYNAERPTLINNGVDHFQYALAYVHRHPTVEKIEQSDITNNVGEKTLPFVTGPLKTVNITELTTQWRAQWAEFVKTYEDTATQWTEEQQASFEGMMQSFNKQMNAFETSAGKEFSEWFESIKELFATDPTGQLQNQIDDLYQKQFEYFYGLVNSNTTINDNTGQIVQTNSIGTATTTFSKSDAGADVITTVVDPSEGEFIYTKKTTIESTSTGSKITTIYTRSGRL